MAEDLNVKIRELIDAFYEGTIAEPVFVGTGQVYFVPSKSKDEVPFHIVAKVQFMDNGTPYRGWVCSCRAFAFGKEDKSFKPHIEQVEDGEKTRPVVKKTTRRKPTTRTKATTKKEK